MFKQKMIVLAAAAFAGWMSLAASSQAQAAHSIEPTPAYEVATIKPWDGKGGATPLRIYIQRAFGIPPNITGKVIGPDWIDSTRYVIQGKPPDSIRDAMQTMTPVERGKEMQLMEQALLADRFKLKTHFEMRELQTYQLVAAKDGPKLKENPDPAKARLAVGASVINGTATTMRNFCGALESEAEIGGHEIIDTTGLSAAYDLSLRWTPMESTLSSSDSERPSLFTAIQEQLGLKLVPVRGPVQVLVIDHIEKPSEN